MANRKLEQVRVYFRVSSSIEPFKEKIQKNFNLPEWKWWMINKPICFFGMYHILDYFRFVYCQGTPKYVCWMGSDIKNLTWLRRKLFKVFKAEHFCENMIEYDLLNYHGIKAKIRPLFFDNIKDFPICYKQSNNPNVFLCMHPGREEEYGLDIVRLLAHQLPDIYFHIYGVWGINEGNISFHGQISNEKFNEEIKQYQCGLRLNAFDGFSEVTAKSILLGQYPITKIVYPWIESTDNIDDLIGYLNRLKYYDKPNTLAKDFWLKNINQLPFL